MKQLMKKMVLFAALCIMIMASGYAQEPSDVETKFNELIQKYDKVKGVECMTVVKGNGLGMLKMVLNKRFGKEFLKGVTRIAFINYSKSSQETCHALRNELDVFKSLMEEFDAGDKKEHAGNDYFRGFALVSDDDKTISDFIIAVEEKETKIIMYMAGKIKVEQ